MNNRDKVKWREDVKRCVQLYESFSDAAPSIKAAYECIEEFFKDFPLTPYSMIDPQAAIEYMREGKSLEINPVLDTKDVIELCKTISSKLAKINPEIKSSVTILKERLDHFILNSPPEVTRHEIRQLFDTLIEETVLEQDLATFLFTITLSSFYRQYAKAAAEVLRTELWSEGNCPLCGEKPHYGILRPGDGAKELECWLCGTKWLHTRIKCPFCSNEEQENLGYFTVENREVCRINFCRSCFQYWKIIDARKFNGSGDIVLPIHNLASLSHDLLAWQEGFRPGSGLEWINSKEIDDGQEAGFQDRRII